MATKRAKKLAKYLEKELGWQVFDDRKQCLVCNTASSGKFCYECGFKLKHPRNMNTTYEELEEALVYAVDKDA